MSDPRSRPPGGPPPPDLPRREGRGAEPWIETPSGGLFFVNALLVAPAVLALFPLALGALLRGLGVVEESPFLDVVPAVAKHFAPYLGWLTVVPLWTTVRNLHLERRAGPRLALAAFLFVHAGVLTYTFWRWMGGGGH